MSEYQYYRFERLEGYLDSKQLSELRSISSRAEITSNSFQVHYHYSDLRAEVTDVVLNYFEIGFYYANWGTINAYIKIPIGTIPDELLQWGDYYYGFHLHETERWQLLIFSLEEYDDYFDDEDADEFFQYLTTLRAELMQGDWRILYFMWLRELEGNNEIEPIPMIAFNFNKLSDAQHAFADLFDIPLASVRALKLALKDEPSHCAKHDSFSLENWLKQLSEEEKDHLLKVMFDQGQLSFSQAIVLTRKEQAPSQNNYQYWLSGQIIEPYTLVAQQQLEREQAIALAKKLAEEKAAKSVDAL